MTVRPPWVGLATAGKKVKKMGSVAEKGSVLDIVVEKGSVLDIVSKRGRFLILYPLRLTFSGDTRDDSDNRAGNTY